MSTQTATPAMLQVPFITDETLTQPHVLSAACVMAVRAAILHVALKPGSSVSLFDLDNTIWIPDNYGFLVDQFGRNSALWHHADRLAAKAHSGMTLRHLFQMALDQVSSDTFDFADVIAKLKLAHRLIPGAKALMDLLESYGVFNFAVSNGIDNLAKPMLLSDGLHLEPICNHCKISPHHILEFEPVDGEIGLSKEAVAEAFIEAGMKIVCAGGDSGADLPLVLAAISQKGFALVRKGCALEKLLAERNVPADSYFVYETFEDEGCLDWVEKQLKARLAQ